MRAGHKTIINESRGVLLGDQVRSADGFWRRLKGLIGTRPLQPGEGLRISPCDCVHTLGMRYALDVLFVDDSGIVVGCVNGLPPNRISPRFRNARAVVELPAGTLVRTGTVPGDRLRFGPP